ncbi:MAG: hypothetical protein RID53_25710 [Coleofasciculus sp. B1-GNL1-01]|uniref:hypothetical protein n=1 Tax=Coleofasciculus sp. B1-GNL1-01 TaxID=3068484 RepID=UPI0032FC8732
MTSSTFNVNCVHLTYLQSDRIHYHKSGYQRWGSKTSLSTLVCPRLQTYPEPWSHCNLEEKAC